MSNERSAKRIKNTSKFISLILRHKPETIGISLDEHGWAGVQELIDGVNQSDGHTLDMELLEEIVRTDEKQRYSFNEDHTLIRANQGHSIPSVRVEMSAPTPPQYLYHGTAERFLPAILKEGLKPMTRQFVHLSAAYDTAVAVGKRHGKPVVLIVRAADFASDGHELYLSANGVWQAKAVPPEYLSLKNEE